jgi:2-polyprenyl-6-hydroxyphenyl methylase/3-demethylubiquinone-9 3-methyltransferase
MVPARFEAFDAIVGNWDGKAVLDLGCGGGFMAEALARRRASVCGVDPSEAAIAAAQRHASASGLKVDYATGTGEAIPHADQTFDIVVCVDVLEHVTDVDRVIAEIDRVLRPGGLLLFDTINHGWLAGFVVVTLAETVIRLIPPGTHDPAMFIPPEALSARLQSHGFLVGRFEGLGPQGMDRRGDLTFGRSPILAIQYLGSARKAA